MTAAEQLADARRKLDLSIDDISARTKVSVERLEAIERIDLAGLPSLVYLKGFVRAYAAEVRLDPDAIAERYVSELPEPDPAMPLEESSSSRYIVPTATAEESLAAFESESNLAGEEASPPDVSRPGLEVISDRKAHSAETYEPQFHAPITEPPTSRRSSRLAPLVAASSLAVIAAFVVSASIDRSGAQRRADSSSAAAVTSSGSDAAEASSKPTEQEPPSPNDAQTSGAAASAQPTGHREVEAAPAARASQDGAVRRPATVARSEVAAPPSSHTSSGALTGGERASAKRPTAPESREASARDAAVPSAAAVVPESAEEPGVAAPGERLDSAEDVSGAWNVTSHVESATLDAYRNLMLGFRLQLEQRGNRVVGSGYKVSENGEAIPAGRRTPINVEGTLDGDRLALDFTEQGTRRTSAGRFVLHLSEDGSFRGRFKSDAAQSSGVTVAVREPAGRH